MSSTYPGAIDGYAQIRIARDGIDEIIAGDHNDLRSAILAIERTLGVNPQGPFGTVVARLNDAYSNIEAHVLGYPPRHQDDVIMSPLRSGIIPGSLESLPYSLPEGPLADQIAKILEYLNDALMYGGSGTSTFADGYALPYSLIRNAITQIVEQLGAPTGTEKIGGNTIVSGHDPSIPTMPAGTLRSQLIHLMDLINNFGNPTGAGLVGTTSFYTSTGNKYQFAGSDVQAQIEEAGDFLDEGASFREKAFNAFVASGMVVSGAGGTANIASGFIAANGRMLQYNGGSISIPDGVTSYVFAEITNGVVIIDVDTSVPTRAENPIVILHKITRAGAVWTTSTDLRRFGVFVNDKNYISVGNTPSSGRDGYGCDFTSLKSAVEFAKTVNSGNDLIPPLKIILASDISITSAAEMEIQLNVDGIQIDGCGRKVTTNIDAALFDVEADNVTIRDITLESNLAVSGSNQCLAHIGNSTNISGVTITNCKILRAGGTACAYFLRLGNAGATTTVSNSVISENIAEVEKGGIEYVSINKYATVLRDSVILGNNIYQSTFSSTSYAGIKASIHCTLGDNIVKGGFDTGILLALPSQCRVDGNLIIGYSSAVIYMNNGIAIWNSAAGQDNGCVISDNTIKGIADYGIDCRAGAGSGAFISVYGNFIDNYYSVGSPPTSMIGIRGRGAETWVVGNKITAPGDYGIENCSHAIGNQIYGHSGVAGSTAAIAVSTSVVGVIADNTIRNVAGTGIYVANNSGMAITGNVLLGNSNSSTGIDYIGSECVVVGNTVMDYVSGGIQSVTGTEITVANNKVIDCQGQGISLDDCTGAIVVGNWLESPVGTGSSGINGVGSYSVIANNYIANYGAGGAWAISLYWAANIDVAITGNVIKNLHINTQGVLYTPGGWSRISVVGNVLDNCPYAGFSFSDADQVLCANNIISGDSTSTSAIGDFGDNSIIIGNIIETYCSNISDIAISAFGSGSNNCVIAGNHITNSDAVGINMEEGTDCIISNNFIEMIGADNAGVHCIKSVGDRSLVSNNILINSNDAGINIAGANGICSGNVINNPYNNGIEIEGGYCIRSGNFIINTGDYGITSTTAFGDGVSFCNNYIINCGSGIYISGTEAHHINSNFLITMKSGDGIYMDGGTYSVISNNYMFSVLVGDGIYVINSDYSYISNNYVYGMGGIGIYSSASTNLHLNGNSIISSTSDGIHVTGSTPNTRIDNNDIRNAGGTGINCTSTSERIRICNNLIYDPSGNGIFGAHSYGMISENQVEFAGGSGIIYNGHGLVVSNNKITSGSGNGIYNPSDGADCVINGNFIGFHYGSFCIRLNASSYRTCVSGNVMRSADWGIECGSDDCVFSNNVVYSTVNTALKLQGVDCIIMGNRAVSVGFSLDCNGASGQLIIGNWFDTAGVVYGNDYLVIGNMCEGGTPGGWGGPPAGVVVAGTNYHAHV